MISDQDALKYHTRGRPGKIEVRPTKPFRTQLDLSLAYSPGVAVPCMEIARDPLLAYDYTIKGNLVGVITNGTAALGLGNIGPLASKPIMEGKAGLFKKFADIDVFDLEVDATDPEELIRIVKALEPTFGGINLEDIKAPDCFIVEERLKKEMTIPVFHDDQHGTAIISAAALLNGLEVVGKDIKKVKVVYLGAGAASISCAKLHRSLGLNPESMFMVDSAGVIYSGREERMNEYKQEFARDTKARTLSDIIKGADVFVGASGPNLVTREMLESMADKPLVFALANPDPEVTYDEARTARPDAIVATGRSDFPNQVNNVLGFPYIFRGALDVGAKQINEEMKLAAVRALADLAKEEVPEVVTRAYGVTRFTFGPDYIIPKPFDPRVLVWESAAVAEAAMKSGVARKQIDIEEYKLALQERMGLSRSVMRPVISYAKRALRKVVFPEGDNERIMLAAIEAKDEGICKPVLLTKFDRVSDTAKRLGVDLSGIEVIDTYTSPWKEEFAQKFWEKRSRKGGTLENSRKNLESRTYFGMMMVSEGKADAVLAGVNKSYTEVVRPAIEVFDLKPGATRVAGLYVVILSHDVYFFADTTVNIDPTAEELAEIALMTSEVARRFAITPRVAMLSFSNFGSARSKQSDKVARATAIVKERAPELEVDGEMQVNLAVSPEAMAEDFPFSTLKGKANVFIFPDLNSGNIAYKLMQSLAGADVLGPVLMGLSKPAHVLQRGSSVAEIVDMAALATAEAEWMAKGE
ncbi:MAG: NADP-dependent malic enzyme [candidate division Zixibacteria bacterium]|nr:NADP-dependent malic enzyme [candidate division Zixibacteria bacterium]